MGEFNNFGRTNDIDFGDYVEIEMFRHCSPNERYLHKVVGAFKSNTWIDVPLKWDSEPTIHSKTEVVLNVIQCGIDESKVIRVRQEDCMKVKKTTAQS